MARLNRDMSQQCFAHDCIERLWQCWQSNPYLHSLTLILLSSPCNCKLQQFISKSYFGQGSGLIANAPTPNFYSSVVAQGFTLLKQKKWVKRKSL